MGRGLANFFRRIDILASVVDKLRTTTNLRVDPGVIRVISGGEEGAFGWLAVQYLAKRLKGMENSGKGLLGVLELGGASTQITFPSQDAVLPSSVSLDLLLGKCGPGAPVTG